MSVRTDIKSIGPTTFMATIAIRNRSSHCNGTMTYRRRVRALCHTVGQKAVRAARRPWMRHWLDRPKHAPPGSYEHARLAHIEMERVALRRPKQR